VIVIVGECSGIKFSEIFRFCLGKAGFLKYWLPIPVRVAAVLTQQGQSLTNHAKPGHT